MKLFLLVKAQIICKTEITSNVINKHLIIYNPVEKDCILVSKLRLSFLKLTL